ncbi:MAG: hypothetical protein IPL61_06150 [Myxococcales bacterium]|nr:hypothetical protein [Myxococcales bacterium]
MSRGGARARVAAVALALVAAVLALVAPPATAQVGPDAGVPGDGGVGGDAGPTRIVIDGPTLLGIGKPQVSASAAPTEMRLGDKFTLFVEVVFDEHVTVSVPSGLDLAPAFDELKRSTVDERRTDGTRKRVYQIQLQAWELGDLRLPPVQVTYSVGGDTSWVVTNEVPLRVVGSIDAIDDPNAFLGATPPVPVRRRDWRWIIALSAVGALAVGLGAWLLIRRARRRARAAVRRHDPVLDAEPLALLDRDPTAATAAAPPPMSKAPTKVRRGAVTWAERQRLGDAARRALAALDELERAGTLATDQPDGYRAMTGIVRTFLLDHLELPSRHRTSSELVRALAGRAVAAEAVAGVERWLAAADLVNFAAAVDAGDGVEALADARELVVTIARGPHGGAA